MPPRDQRPAGERQVNVGLALAFPVQLQDPVCNVHRLGADPIQDLHKHSDESQIPGGRLVPARQLPVFVNRPVVSSSVFWSRQPRPTPRCCAIAGARNSDALLRGRNRREIRAFEDGVGLCFGLDLVEEALRILEMLAGSTRIPGGCQRL